MKKKKKVNIEYKNVDVNKKNLEEYEKLMKTSAYNYDSYFSSNNPIIQLILLVLAIFIVCGVVYFLLSGLSLL